MAMMRFLCLHGKGTSADIFKAQTSSFRSKLSSSPSSTITFDFDFVDAPLLSDPAPSIDQFYRGPYYSFWDGYPPTVSAIRDSHKWLLDRIASHGPYDGVLTFSQGVAVVASYLLYHEAETPDRELPFKAAVFICGGLSLPVLEDLGVNISEEAWEWDARSRADLREKASSIATAVRSGLDVWDNNNTKTQNGVKNGTKKEQEQEPTPLLPQNNLLPQNKSYHDSPITALSNITPSNVFGLDFTQPFLKQMKIKIPTVHIYGSKDPRLPASVQLAQMCDPSQRKMFNHEGGHFIPRKREVSEGIAGLVEWVVGRAMVQTVGKGEKKGEEGGITAFG